MVNPGVFVNLAAQKHAAVGAFFAENLRLLNLGRILNQHSAALAHAVVFGLMEGIAAVVADSAERLSLVRGHNCLRRVLHNLEVVTPGNVHNRVHLTGDACVVNRHNGNGLVGDGVLNFGLVDVHGVGTNVHKHQLGAAQHKRVGGGAERKRRQNHLVAGLDIKQQRRHFERVRAGRGEQRLGGAGFFFQPLMAPLGKGTIATDFMVMDSFLNKLGFRSQIRRDIKRYHIRFLPVPFCNGKMTVL